MKNDSSSESGSDLGGFFAFILLRLWLALRAIFTGIEKFSGQKSSEVAVVVDGEPNSYGRTSSDSDKVYGLQYYKGIPEALGDKLKDEPLLPGFAMGIFDVLLGPVLILSGLTLLLGIATRISLFVQGLLYCFLTVGLILLKQDGGIAWLAIHVLLVVVALLSVKNNRFQLFAKKL